MSGTGSKNCVEVRLEEGVILGGEYGFGEEEIKKKLIQMMDFMGFIGKELSVLLCLSDRMRGLNGKYRGEEGVTDVLSFEGGEVYVGDIVVCVEEVLRQGCGGGVGLWDDLLRILIHGLLHLLGYDHGNDLEEREMRRMEERIYLEVK